LIEYEVFVTVIPGEVEGNTTRNVTEIVVELAKVTVGAANGPRGVVAEDVPAVEFPAELVATTWNVYEVPLLSVETMQVSGPEVQVHVLAPGVDVTT